MLEKLGKAVPIGAPGRMIYVADPADLFPGSTATRQVIAYFQLNPDEQLTLRDICTKFGVTTQSYIKPTLAQAVELGLLAKHRAAVASAHPTDVYSKGPTLIARRLPSALADVVSREAIHG